MKKITGADLFPIITADIYPSAYPETIRFGQMQKVFVQSLSAALFFCVFLSAVDV